MAEENVTSTAGAAETAQTETKPEAAAEQQTETGISTEALEKIVQSRVDRSTAELGKKIAALQKENDKLKKDGKSAEEVKQLEISEREKTIAAKEKELQDRENRLFALKAIKEIGLDDGSPKSLSLVDFVMAEDEATITERVKAFNDLVQSFVSAQVDAKFKAIGRTPNGAAAQNGGEDKKLSVAESLGKRRAEQAKKSNDVLSMYLGGKK